MTMLPKTSSLAKANLGLCVIAVALYAVGFACSYWITKDFTVLLVPSKAFPVPFPLNVTVEAHMGLLESCKKATYPIGGKVVEECGQDDARTWQYIATSFGLAGLVAAVVSLVTSLMGVAWVRVAGHPRLRAVIIVADFLACGFIVTALIIYSQNLYIQVNSNLPDQFYFEIDWAFYVSAVAAAAFLVLMLLNVVDLRSSNGKAPEASRLTEPSVKYYTGKP